MAGEQQTSVIQHTTYDERVFTDTMLQFPRLAELMATASLKLPGAPALIRDVFYSMYQPAPLLAEPDDLTPSASIHRGIMESLMNTSQWANVRGKGIGNTTVGDQLYSAMATVAVSRAMLKALDAQTTRRLRQLQENEQQIERLHNEAETYDDVAEERKDRAEDLHERAEAARFQAREAQKKVEALASGLAERSEEIEDATRAAARNSLEAAAEEIEEFDNAMQAYSGGPVGSGNKGFSVGTGSGSGSGSGRGRALREKLELANRVNKSDKLKQVAELTGRMVRIAMEVQRTKTDFPPTHITGVERGNNVANLLPSELALLGDPRLHPLFAYKYVTGELMQYKLKGLQPQGKGPIIVALDDSGSMDGQPEIWAKACALALLAIARLQERDFALIHFSDDLKTFFYPKGAATPQQIMTMTEFFYGGGTQFWPWMEEALRLAERSEFEKADVICITDGAAYLTQEQEAEWNERRHAKGMRCRSILIDEYGHDSMSQTLLGHIGETITTISDLRQDNDTLQTMYSV